MADGAERIPGLARMADRTKLSRILPRVVLAAAYCAGFAGLAVAFFGPTPEWRLFALILLACLWVNSGFARATWGERCVLVCALALMAAWGACVWVGCPMAVLYMFASTCAVLISAAAAALVRLATQASAGAKAAAAAPVDEDANQFVDPTTGLANRRYALMLLQRELSRSQRSRKPLSLAIFDLDNLRETLEEVGKEALDSGLAQMGAALKAGLRDYDLVARYSAGRLLALLPETPAESAHEIVERLHQSVTSVLLNGRPASVTVGISAFPDHGETPEELVNSAHHALNRGRFVGANQVHSLQDLAKAA